MHDRQSDERVRPPLLRPSDQASVTALLACSLLLIAAYWCYQGGYRGELIDIDRAEPLQAEFLVNVNRAQTPELIQLPGIGPKLAERILKHREEHGNFARLENLAEVKGIGPRTLAGIRPYLIPIPSDSNVAQAR